MEEIRGSVSIEAQNIMPIIKKWLYSDKDIFIREVISNGCDAITKLRLTGADTSSCCIRVEVDKAKKELRFLDDGVGMTAEEVTTNINQVAFSGAKSFLAEYAKEGEDAGIIGHFGLGFYSVFMVSDKVEIDTLSFREGAEPVHWESEDGMSFSMTSGTRETRGTTITLHIADAEAEFLDLWRVRQVLDRYCSFMAVPIYLTEIKEEKEEEKKEDDEVSVKDADEPEEEKAEKPVNNPHPLYTKAPQDCTDEEYKQFFRDTFHEFEDPLFWIHLNVDYPFKMKGILYFPKLADRFGSMEGQIKLYSGQVFVADNIKEVIPEFLMLLKGVIDCEDFPLNVSRSFLQNDGYVRRISNHITKKVADRLTGMFKTEREAYEGFWPDIHPFIKYGVIRDMKFAERMKDVMLFKTTEGKYLTLSEYKERNGEKLPDKMVYTNDPARQDAAVRLFTERGIDVSVLDHMIDAEFLSYLEYSGNSDDKFRFCRVDAELDSLTDKDAGETPNLDIGKLAELVHEALGQQDLPVEVKPLANESIPVMLIEDEHSRRFTDMSRLYGRSELAMPKKYSVVLNSRSATIQKLSDRTKDEQSLLLTKQLCDLAELSRQPLEAERMTEFIRRSMEIVDMAAKL